MEILTEILICLLHYFLFLIPAVLVLLLIRIFTPVPAALFRKLLHGIAFLSAPVIARQTHLWYIASASLALFGAAVYPLLVLFERWKGYSGLFVEKGPHEIRRSLLLLFFTDAVILAVGWGIFQQKETACAAILMWGTGDAAAALIGKRFGRHPLHLPFADPKKTWEGSLAMFVTSALTGFLYILLAHPLKQDPVSLIVCCLVTSLFGTYTEAVTTGGNDTVTVPVISLIVLLFFRT